LTLKRGITVAKRLWPRPLVGFGELQAAGAVRGHALRRVGPSAYSMAKKIDSPRTILGTCHDHIRNCNPTLLSQPSLSLQTACASRQCQGGVLRSRLSFELLSEAVSRLRRADGAQDRASVHLRQTPMSQRFEGWSKPRALPSIVRRN
jgi:hypothetical protein